MAVLDEDMGRLLENEEELVVEASTSMGSGGRQVDSLVDAVVDHGRRGHREQEPHPGYPGHPGDGTRRSGGGQLGDQVLPLVAGVLLVFVVVVVGLCWLASRRRQQQQQQRPQRPLAHRPQRDGITAERQPLLFSGTVPTPSTISRTSTTAPLRAHPHVPPPPRPRIAPRTTSLPVAAVVGLPTYSNQPVAGETHCFGNTPPPAYSHHDDHQDDDHHHHEDMERVPLIVDNNRHHHHRHSDRHP